MAYKEVAVEGMTLSHDATVATLTPVTLPVDDKAEGAKMYFGDTVIQVSGAVKGSCSQTAPVNLTLLTTAEKVRKVASGDVPLRKDDEGTVNIIGTSGGSGCNFNITVTVANAGQTKVRAK